jgi:hypothetical protein
MRKVKPSKHRFLNDEVSELKGKSELQEVFNVCPKTGDYIKGSEVKELSETTRVINWITRYRGRDAFCFNLRNLIKKCGYGSLTDKQKVALANKYRYHTNIKKRFNSKVPKTRDIEKLSAEINKRKKKIKKIGEVYEE